MPWCEECSRFLTPTSMGPGGECPSCGRVVAAEAEPASGEEEEAPHAPWHFKLLLVATVLYLGFRAVQGIVWLIGRF
ncbi:MAG TPA: hypothetical protein VFJ85_10455 [Acidimicrobiales bacterium]|nr:hypothetical protein [Acidimicrobiales bacterium]